MTATGERWGVVGGGMLGLTLAHRLAQGGHDVTVIEGAPELGGLASAWSLGDVVWDRHYHVTLLSDGPLRALLDELALEEDMEWVKTRTGCYTGGRLHSVSNTLEFLRFPPLAVVDKLRLGGTLFYGSKVRNWRRLERVPVERWLTRWSGRRAFESFWLPLLRSKLGESYQESSAAFLWATIQRLNAARRSGLKNEMFGYVPGGYARVLGRFAEVLLAEGVKLQLGSPVARVEAVDEGVLVVHGDTSTSAFDKVAVTANASVAARLVVGLSPDERARLEAIRYQGIVCVSLLLEQPLSPYYLTYITDPGPFTAVVEMTALVDPARFGGRSLVYLPKYCPADDPLMRAPDGEVEETALTTLESMYPHFRREQVVSFRVSRVREVFPIPSLGYSTRVPDMRCSVPGVHLVTSAQIVNGTLNVNETVRLADGAARELTRGTGRSGQEAVTGVPPPDRPAIPLAGLSLDLDDLWSYMRTHGDHGWESLPSYLDVVVPRVLGFLRQRGLTLTFFVVGQDAALERNRDVLTSIAAAGHEIGNHSFMHEPWLHLFPPDRVEDEVVRAEEAIELATGVRPRGFRAPGFSLSSATLDVLARRGCQYDASTLPTFIGPLARAWFMRGADLTDEERSTRRALYGAFREGTRRNRPYRWQLEGSRLLELPVTTMPLLRTPIHMTYLLFLSELSPALARSYFAWALRLCRWRGVEPSILLHSHDFVGADDGIDDLSFFPGIKMATSTKLRRVGEYLDMLTAQFDVVPLGRRAEALAVEPGLPSVRPRFFQKGRSPR